MSELHVEATRGTLVEMVHRVSVAVVDRTGRLIAAAGDPSRVAYWRSAAKPFQAVPLIDDGAAAAFGFEDDALALACASHSSEPVHRAVVAEMLRRIGAPESALACGPHPPLSAAIAEQAIQDGVAPTPLWSNCSGNHAGMLALARHHGWSWEGYQREGHPVQDRLRAEIARWTDVRAGSIPTAVDGCTTVTFGLPLTAMALAWARFGASDEAAPVRLRQAMTARPDLVAGTGRLCTALMTALPRRVLAKVGADGIYCAAVPPLGLGLALKVADGNGEASGVALLAALAAVTQRVAPGEFDWTPLAAHSVRPILDTRGGRVGALRSAGLMRFHA